MQSRDPGFNRDQVVTIPLDEITFRKFDVVKQELLSNTFGIRCYRLHRMYWEAILINQVLNSGRWAEARININKVDCRS